MKRLRYFVVIATILLILHIACLADTFTNNQTGEILHGYTTAEKINGKSLICTIEKGTTALDMKQWSVTDDRKGRNSKIIVLTVNQQVTKQIVAEAFEQALTKAIREGPLLILLQIDTVEGEISFIKRICEAIINNSNCEIVCFINGGKYSGALGSAAGIALACDKIYMAEGATLGAATPIKLANLQVAEVNQIADPNTEQMEKQWHEYFLHLAGRNNRPQLLAKAMLDMNLEVIEIDVKGQRKFVEPQTAIPANVVQIWSKKGSLLTLTASEAVQCGFAEGLVDSPKELLHELNVENALIVRDNQIQQAARTYKKAKLKFDRLRSSLDLKIKQIEQTTNVLKALRLLREIRDDYKSLLLLAKRYPDLSLDIELIQQQVDLAESYYEHAKTGN